MLCGRVSSSIVDPSHSREAVLIAEVVRASIESFVASRGDLVTAVSDVAPLVHQAGVREGRRHPDPSRLDRSFQLAHVAVQRGLPLVVGELVTQDALTRLREDLMAYVTDLHRTARAGFERTARIQAMNQEQRLGPLRACAFHGHSVTDLDEIAGAAGFDPARPLAPIVSVEISLPVEIREHHEAIASEDGFEALVPEHWSLEAFANLLTGQVVMGPSVPLAGSHESITLARNAAALLRDGSVEDDRIIVPSTDLLGELLLRGNRLLGDLLIDKHLGPLERLSAGRRRVLVDVLLLSLERGLPVNRIARELGIAAQTAHNRMKLLRSLLGDKLDDADQRLELLVAVRAATGRWKKP